MKHRLPFHPSLSFVVCLSVLLIPLLLCSASRSHEIIETDELLENEISIAFDLEESSMTGTSKIVVHPDVPLVMFFGNLEITGSILEVEGRPHQVLVPTDQQTFTIPPSKIEQTLFISWKLTADGTGDNLISDRGITLAGLWHPLPNMDMAYRLEARLPEGFTAISEGDIVAYCLDKSQNRYLTTEFSHPVPGIHFAAGPYTVKSRELPGDITLSAFFFEEDLSLADEYLDKAEYYIQLYEKMIGPFPFNRYSIVENRLPTGYGMPTFTLLGQAVVRLPFIKDTSLGHEVLHSWFGNNVRIRSMDGNWTEGLTTYLADHYYAEQEGKDIEYRKNQLLRYGSYVPEDNDITLKEFINASHSQPASRQVRAVGYDKSSMVFHMLRKQVGDDLFFHGLRLIYQKYHDTRIGWEEFEEVYSNISGQDLEEFFYQWLTRWDIPQLNIGHIDITQVKGQSKLTFILEQRNIFPYEFQLPLVVTTRNAEVRKTIEITEQNQEIEIFSDALPLEMIIDPDYDLMRAVSYTETPPLISQFMGAENKTAVLGEAADAEEIYGPLLPVLERMGANIVAADELANEELGKGSFVFLGKSKHSLGLFADPNHFPVGVTVDVRRNPLDPGQVAVLITSPNVEQTKSITRKLSHYGKYSFLYFENGRALKKNTVPTSDGIRIDLLTEPEVVRTPDIRPFDQIIDEIKDSKVIYVGEMHTDVGSHLLQLQVIQALYQEDPKLAIGMEMFPRTKQQALDDYINGKIETEAEFLKKSDYFNVWGFDYRFYRDIIGYAHRNKIPIVGLNIEKSIVSQVFKDGTLDNLDEEQITAVPPERKLDEPGYRQRLIRAFSTHDRQSFTPEKVGGFIQAQSIWDETMADSIVKYLTANPDHRMVIIAGNGHVYKDNAIPSRVKRRIDVPQSVISSINFEKTGLVPGYKIDYLVYTEQMELQPAPKVGIVLETEKVDPDSDETRLRIKKISPHGKAGEAGIKEDDVILTLEGQKIQDITDMKLILMDKQVGNMVTMKVLREHMIMPDEELELEVELSNPMQMSIMPPSHPK